MAAHINYPCLSCHPSEYLGKCLYIKISDIHTCAHIAHSRRKLFTLQVLLVLHDCVINSFCFKTESNVVFFWAIYISVTVQLALAQVTVSYK